MQLQDLPLSFSVFTICGLTELDSHSRRAVTHVLSILDPGWPDPPAFGVYDRHHRTVLNFHDEIEQRGTYILPTRADVQRILDFGRDAESMGEGIEHHLLVHCHMGLSRSTAAMATLLAQAAPDASEDSIFEKLIAIRPQAWPNSRMIGFADDLLGREGRFTAALARHYARQLVRSPDIAAFMIDNGRSREIDMAKSAGAGPNG